MKNNPNITTGVELELNLIDTNGYLVNIADEILNSLTPGQFPWITGEPMNCQLEVISRPCTTINELETDLKEKLTLLEQICQSFGVQVTSASEYGAGKGELNKHKRFPIYELVLGTEQAYRLMTTSGTHNHLSWPEDKANLLKMFQFNMSLDSTFAFDSTSPISNERKNGLNCHRIYLQRYGVGKEAAAILGSRLEDYPRTLEEIQQRLIQRHKLWKKISATKGVPNEVFEKLFQPENTGYHTPRMREVYGTYENRVGDSVPLDLLCARAAIYKGGANLVLTADLPVTIADKDGFWRYNPNETIILPNHKTLQRLEQSSIHYGLERKGSVIQREFLAEVLEFSNAGLKDSEKHYLVPNQQALKSGENIATQLTNLIRDNPGYSGTYVSPELAAKVNLSTRERYLKGLNPSEYIVTQAA